LGRQVRLLDPVDEQLRQITSHLLEKYVTRSERGMHHGGFNVVEADHAYVFRNA
jgi:hypothetical protein